MRFCLNKRKDEDGTHLSYVFSRQKAIWMPSDYIHTPDFIIDLYPDILSLSGLCYATKPGGMSRVLIS
jgi:hypothetical protein